MKNEKDLESLLALVKNLSEKDKSSLADQIMKMLAKPSSKEKVELRHTLAAESTPGKPDCPHCAAKASLGYIIKKGYNKGSQRYYCKSCGKYFVPTTNTTFAYSRKDAETWRKFIQLTISGASLKVCEEECGLAHLTAFTWRHKVLNAFAMNQESIQMSGNVEVDEMFIPISYKGNHVKGAFGKRERHHGESNNLPRKSYCRGTDNKSNSAKNKACVFCMVENGDKNFFAAVPGVGFMTDPMLDVTVAKHVNKDKAMILADDYRVTKNYFEQNGFKHTILLSNTSENRSEHKPEVRNGLHLQHVNAMHHHIRDFLRPYCGVSTKYLSNYISLFVWLKNVAATRQKKTADKVSVARTATPDCYITYKDLSSRPAIPKCA